MLPQLDTAVRLFYPISWTAGANYFLVIYALVNIIIITNPHDALHNLRIYMPLVWAATAGFLLFFMLCQRYSPRLHPAYVKLSPMAQQHWNMRIMSTFHAIVVSLGGAIALTDPALRENMLETWSPVVGPFVCIFLGYCVLDTWMTLAYHDEALGGGFAIILHHAMVMSFALYPLNAHRFGMIAACYLLNEISTPFMNTIHFFRDIEVPKSSKWALANSIMFLGSYFFCRVCVNTYVLFELIKPGSVAWSYPAWLLLSGGGFVVAFWMLNLFWFYKIMSHAVKLLCRKTPPQEQYQTVSDTALDENAESIELGMDEKDSEYSFEQYEMA